jgi:hypothetical protein
MKYTLPEGYESSSIVTEEKIKFVDQEGILIHQTFVNRTVLIPENAFDFPSFFPKHLKDYEEVLGDRFENEAKFKFSEMVALPKILTKEPH